MVEESDATTQASHSSESVADGTLNEIQNLYRSKDHEEGEYEWIKDIPSYYTKDPAEDEKTAKYAILVRNQRASKSHKTLEIHSIVVQSPLLKKALAYVLKEYPGQFLGAEPLVFHQPFRMFFHRWEALKRVRDQESEPKAKLHLQLLYRILEGELRDDLGAFEVYKKSNMITYEHLWTLFVPRELIYSTQHR